MRANIRPRVAGRILSGLAGLALLFSSSLANAEATERQRVLVELRVRAASEPLVLESEGPRAVAIQRARIAQAQVAVANEARIPAERIFARYQTLPFLAAEVDATELAVLERSWRVRRVAPDELLVAPARAGAREARPLPPRPRVDGWHVAVLDTGLARGARSAARGAEPLPLAIYSEAEGEVCGAAGSPCILTWRSDQIAALERIYELRHSVDIASVELRFRSRSGGPTHEAASFAAIDQLHEVGIPTVSAADDEAYATHETPTELDAAIAAAPPAGDS